MNVNRWLIAPTGISWEQLAAHPEGVQYAPIRLEKYRRKAFPTPSGRFEFAAPPRPETCWDPVSVHTPPPYRWQADSRYPWVLITGARTSFYYHSRNRNIRRFRKSRPGPEIELHPADARGLQVKTGDRIKVSSPRGAIFLLARVVSADAILPGVVQIPHGWDEANVNRLTDDRDLDAVSGLPNMKIVMVHIVRADAADRPPPTPAEDR